MYALIFYIELNENDSTIIKTKIKKSTESWPTKKSASKKIENLQLWNCTKIKGYKVLSTDSIMFAYSLFATVDHALVRVVAGRKNGSKVNLVGQPDSSFGCEWRKSNSVIILHLIFLWLLLATFNLFHLILFDLRCIHQPPKVYETRPLYKFKRWNYFFASFMFDFRFDWSHLKEKNSLAGPATFRYFRAIGQSKRPVRPIAISAKTIGMPLSSPTTLLVLRWYQYAALPDTKPKIFSDRTRNIINCELIDRI